MESRCEDESRIPLAFVLPPHVMVAISNVMPVVVITTLIFWSIRYSRHMRARSRAQAAELGVGRG
jgi:hypothetical protein